MKMKIRAWHFLMVLRISVLLCIVLVTGLLLTSPKEYGERSSMLDEIKKSINSVANTEQCIIPDLALDCPEMKEFYDDNIWFRCGERLNDWVTCEKSTCFIKPEVALIRGKITCEYTDLFRVSDSNLRHRKAAVTDGSYTLNKTDFVRVSCTDEIGTVWRGLGCGIREGVKPKVQPPKLPFYNVLMIGFASLSRNGFIRKLSKTYEYLTNNLNATVLQGYNIVGSDSQQALIPILTGHTELELPEARRRKKGSFPLDVYPMIWKVYEQRGYYTAFNKDPTNYGVFSYRLKDFNKQPTDHYLRTFFLEAQTIQYMNNKLCIGSLPAHTFMLDYTRNFMEAYADHPKFAFSFHGGLSQHTMRYIANADTDILGLLHSLKNGGLLDNTFLIVMSDHGHRFFDSTKLLQAKQEERLPFFSVTFPKDFALNHPNEYQNFQQNAHRLTTPFDIHETLHHILKLRTPAEHVQSFGQPIHGISLFKPIPRHRSCASAFIPPQWCTCLKSFRVSNTSSPLARKLVTTVLATINAATETHRNVCQLLKVKKTKWLLHVIPHKELVNFKRNVDIDELIPEFSASRDTKSPNSFYQVEIVTQPGGLVFRATVEHDLSNFSSKTSLSQVTRVTESDCEAPCLQHVATEIRKFCYCVPVDGVEDCASPALFMLNQSNRTSF